MMNVQTTIETGNGAVPDSSTLIRVVEAKSIRTLLSDAYAARQALTALNDGKAPCQSEGVLCAAENRLIDARARVFDWFLYEHGVPGSELARVLSL